MTAFIQASLFCARFVPSWCSFTSLCNLSILPSMGLPRGLFPASFIVVISFATHVSSLLHYMVILRLRVTSLSSLLHNMVIPRFRVTYVSSPLHGHTAFPGDICVDWLDHWIATELFVSNYILKLLCPCFVWCIAIYIYIAVCFAMCLSAYRLVNYVERTLYPLQLNEEYIFVIYVFSYYGQYRKMSARKLCFAELCNERPCAPGSICTRSIDAPYYHCSCRVGRTGQNCDIGANSITNTSSTLLLPIITDVMSMLLRRYVDVVPTLCIIVFVFSNRWRC